MSSHHATGPFEVSLAPQPLSDVAAPAGLGRMSLDKRFHGELEATSQGEMLSWRDAAQTAGVPQQSITVVPGSGTGALAGLSGRMEVVIGEGGAHSYRFDWSLPD